MKYIKKAVGDVNKPRLSLIPKNAMYAMAAAFSAGEVERGDTHSYKAGIPISYLIDGALRHTMQFLDGEDLDEGTKSHHLGCAMANLAMAIDLHMTRNDIDDRWKPEATPQTQNVPTASIGRYTFKDSEGEVIETAGGKIYKDGKNMMSLDVAIKTGLVTVNEIA